MADTTYTYNREGAIDIDAVRNNTEMGDSLEAMKAEIARAREAGALSAEIESNLHLYLNQAAREVRMPVPSKPTLIDHLNDAREWLSDAGALPEMQRDLSKAVDVVKSLP